VEKYFQKLWDFFLGTIFCYPVPSLAVIFGVFSVLAGTQQILLQSRERRGPNLIFMSLKHPPPPLPASIFSITPLNSGPKWAKYAKNSKKSVINTL
jgi:hypothetical protein